MDKIDKISKLMNGELDCQYCPLKKECDEQFKYSFINENDCHRLILKNFNRDDIWEDKDETEYFVGLNFKGFGSVKVRAKNVEEAREKAIKFAAVNNVKHWNIEVDEVREIY